MTIYYSPYYYFIITLVCLSTVELVPGKNVVIIGTSFIGMNNLTLNSVLNNYGRSHLILESE